MKSQEVSRRTFLKTASAASALFSFPSVVRSQGTAQGPNNRLNIALVGVGGRGRASVNGLATENYVAFCDVDNERAKETFEKHPGVPRFRDYRRMLDKLGNQIDAVSISTPDHMHFPIAVAALQMGKHVFCEKPLTHTIWEARQLAELASGKRVATQMGNQGHASESTRLLKEWYQAGVLGEVREIRSWTNRPTWPQGVTGPDHSKFIPVTPATLDWDLWLGVAAARPYDPAYVPFNWRGYWDFSTGALGDMGCHIMDGGYWALDLGSPSTVEVASANQTDVSAPTAAVATYHFPGQGSRPPLKWTWYDGGMQPPLPAELEPGRPLPPSGNFIMGSKAVVMTDSHFTSVQIVPKIKMRELASTLPPKTIPRVEGGHFAEWLRACKGGPPAGSNFSYASRLTELCLLSNVAARARRLIEWDSATMKITNIPEANQYLTKKYRPGFGV